MKSIRTVTLCGVIAALYVALTWVTLPIAFSPVQLRISEALTVLPFFFPESALALTVGCFISNLLSGYGALDLVFGPIATLLGGVFTALFGISYRKRFSHGIRKVRFYEYPLASFPPVLFNSAIIPAVIAFSATEGNGFFAAYTAALLPFFASEAASCFILGIPLCFILNKYSFINFIKGKQPKGRQL